MKSRKVMGLLAIVVVLIGAAGTARAQSTATVRGTVTDPQGAVTPGVSIVIRNQQTGVERAVVTDTDGVYVAASLPPGSYRVEAELQGFQKQTKDVVLGVAETVVADMRLGVGGVVEQVNVTAAARSSKRPPSRSAR